MLISEQQDLLGRYLGQRFVRPGYVGEVDELHRPVQLRSLEIKQMTRGLHFYQLLEGRHDEIEEQLLFLALWNKSISVW